MADVVTRRPRSGFGKFIKGLFKWMNIILGLLALTGIVKAIIYHEFGTGVFLAVFIGFLKSWLTLFILVGIIVLLTRGRKEDVEVEEGHVQAKVPEER
jgi:hypothetical protein